MTKQVDQAKTAEATSNFLVVQHLQGNPAIQEFMDGLGDYQRTRFEQIALDLGFTLFHEGQSRHGGQRQLRVEDQAVVLAREATLFLQGAAEFGEYLDS